jgi:hypothetical protein
MLFIHLAVNYTKAGWTRKVMLGLAVGWVAFGLVGLYIRIST